MDIRYHEFDGEHRFLSPDQLFPPRKFIQFILQYGEQALEALPSADEQTQQLIEQMIQAGLLERGENGELRLTPRMVKGIEHRAFLEIFRELRAGHRGEHASLSAGRSRERLEGVKPYTFGDPLSELAIMETMRNAIQRSAKEGRGPGDLLPLRLRDDDLSLYHSEATTESAIAILIDLSGSMSRYGRYIQAKRIALGMKALVERRFPMDRLHFIGFASHAEVIPENDLPLTMPKPITVRDWEVRMRAPLDQADELPPHFTNLQHALLLARSILAREGAPNKQIFIITDGQPTAHIEKSAAEVDMLYLIYPPSEQTWEITLAEAHRCSQRDIRISTFALIEDYYYMEWVGFVEQLTRLTRGVAYYCTAGDLAGAIMESYLAGKRKKTTIGAR
ncbi:MAG: VWA domain-containing protein [Phycisphaerales bacterium]